MNARQLLAKLIKRQRFHIRNNKHVLNFYKNNPQLYSKRDLCVTNMILSSQYSMLFFLEDEINNLEPKK